MIDVQPSLDPRADHDRRHPDPVAVGVDPLGRDVVVKPAQSSHVRKIAVCIHWRRGPRMIALTTFVTHVVPGRRLSGGCSPLPSTGTTQETAGSFPAFARSK